MKCLLDTCVISEFSKPYPEKKLLEWIGGIPSERLYLSAITIGEIRKGLTKLPNSRKKVRIAEWLNSLIEDYGERILPIDLVVAESWGEVQGLSEKQGIVISTIDGLIASVARTNNLVLVTRNEKDFENCKIPIFNPWKLKNSEDEKT